MPLRLILGEAVYRSGCTWFWVAQRLTAPAVLDFGWRSGLPLRLYLILGGAAVYRCDNCFV
jgi:hypothetical protein